MNNKRFHIYEKIKIILTPLLNYISNEIKNICTILTNIVRSINVYYNNATVFWLVMLSYKYRFLL